MSIFNNGIEILKIMNNGIEISKIMNNGVEVFTKASAPEHDNLVLNGDFTNGFTSWSYDGVVISTAEYYSSPQSCLETNQEQFCGQTISGAIDDQFYCVCMGHHTSGAFGALWACNLGDFGDIVEDQTSLTGSWEKLSFIRTAVDAGMRIWVAYYDAPAVCVNYYDDVMVVNLTDLYGAGNEPDLAWCDANLEFVL